MLAPGITLVLDGTSTKVIPELIWINNFIDSKLCGVQVWPIYTHHRNILGVRLVPKAEVNLGILNGSYRESWPSDFVAQGRLGALNGLLILLASGG